MAERKYYWLKLKEDFFDSKRIKKLRRLAGGDTMTIIYLKMQLMSIKTEGVLQYTGLEQSFAEELALDLDESPEDVGLTLNYLLAVGLIETSDKINFLLPYAAECIGSETSGAERVRAFREREKQKALHCNADVTEVKRLCNTDIEKEIDIEKRDREKIKHKYGEYHHVMLTDVDMEKLKAMFPTDLNAKIKALDEYIEETGKTYKNHYLTITRWAKKDESKDAQKKGLREG